MGTLALIGLGSNLGDRRAILDEAIVSLSATSGVVVRAVSKYHETEPVGGPDGQGPFLNAAVALDVGIGPFELHRRLHTIEQEAGRVREVRWGERTLDLDLLLFGDRIIDTPDLTVPHLRMAVRRFVLAPLAEIAPDAVDPLSKMTVAQLLAWIDRRPGYVALSGIWMTGLHDEVGSFEGPQAVARESMFSRIVKGLDGFPLSYEKIGSLAAYVHEFGMDGAEKPDSERIEARIHLEQQSRELFARRWPDTLIGDRWIITDYALLNTIEHAEKVFTVSDRISIEETALSALHESLAPTFIVRAGSSANRPLAEQATDRSEILGVPHRVWMAAPTLVVRFPVPELSTWEELSHRLSRETGSLQDWKANYLKYFDRLSAESAELLHRYRTAIKSYEDNLVKEVLAACAASRATSTIH